MNGRSRAIAGQLAWLLSCAGCVLPLGPEFVPEQPAAPVALNVRPAAGTLVTDRNQIFEVLVLDPNNYDTLHARWFIDYPPYNRDLSRYVEVPALPPSGPDDKNQHLIKFHPNCNQGISRTLSRHRLMLVVSDRAFDDSSGTSTDPRLEKVPTDANTISLFWTFDLECP